MLSKKLPVWENVIIYQLLTSNYTPETKQKNSNSIKELNVTI